MRKRNEIWRPLLTPRFGKQVSKGKKKVLKGSPFL